MHIKAKDGDIAYIKAGVLMRYSSLIWVPNIYFTGNILLVADA